MKPDVLICDESVSALDVSLQATVLNLLLDLQDEWNDVIFISPISSRQIHGDDMLVMKQGAIVERGNADALRCTQKSTRRNCLNAIPRGYSG